jgi:ankyrin repeat protein
VTGSPADRIEREFVAAIAARDAPRLRALLADQPSAQALIDKPLFSFDSPALAHVAGGDDSLDLVNVLLEFGADPNRKTGWWAGGFHPLYSAGGAVAERLIEAGASIDACAAAHLDRLDVLRRLLDDDPGRVADRGGDGQTPLHFAQSREAIDLLLERGADPDARDRDHRATPAQWMLAHRRGEGRYALAAYLVERGASADIMLAAALGLEDRVRALLDENPALLEQRTHRGLYGEEPPSSYHIYTWTIGANLSPLDVAARFDQASVRDVMYSYASPKVRFLDACARGDGASARQLLAERPAVLDELSPADRQLLPDAAWNSNAAAVAVMLECGFDPAVRGGSGGTVLHCGAWEGCVACIEAALRYPAVRALVNEPDPNYQGTPLGWCCHGAVHCRKPGADYPTVAALLLSAGARPPDSLDGVPEPVAAVIGSYRSNS